MEESGTDFTLAEISSITLGQLNLKDGYIKVMGKGSKERVVPIGKFVQMTIWHYVNKVRPQRMVLAG